MPSADDFAAAKEKDGFASNSCTPAPSGSMAAWSGRAVLS